MSAGMAATNGAGSTQQVPAAPAPATPKPVKRSSTSVSTSSNAGGVRDPLAGHQGHLTESQEQSLNAFKALAFAQGLYIREPVPSHDDATLLRYLRARRWEAAAAVKQFKETEAWRKTAHIDSFFAEYPIETYDQARKVYPCWTGRRTKRGLPYYVYKVNDLDKKTMSQFLHSSSGSPKKNGKQEVLPVVALYESMMQLVCPMASKLRGRPDPETPVTTCCNIVDISGVGLMQFLKLKGHLGDASALATAKYPETLDSIFVIGAPPYVETVFQFISQWFDANTRSKISVLGTNPQTNLQRLTEVIDIDDLPKEYGGNLDWTCGDLPNLDPAIVRDFGVDRLHWPMGPMKMIGDDIVALGTTKGGQQRREIIGTLKQVQ